MASAEVVVVSVVGSSVAMGGALAFGFRAMVGVVANQLKTQNNVIERLSTRIEAELGTHIESCKVCQTSAVTNAAQAVATAAESATKAVLAAAGASHKQHEESA